MKLTPIKPHLLRGMVARMERTEINPNGPAIPSSVKSLFMEMPFRGYLRFMLVWFVASIWEAPAPSNSPCMDAYYVVVLAVVWSAVIACGANQASLLYSALFLLVALFGARIGVRS